MIVLLVQEEAFQVLMDHAPNVLHTLLSQALAVNAVDLANNLYAQTTRLLLSMVLAKHAQLDLGFHKTEDLVKEFQRVL